MLFRVKPPVDKTTRRFIHAKIRARKICLHGHLTTLEGDNPPPFRDRQDQNSFKAYHLCYQDKSQISHIAPKMRNNLIVRPEVRFLIFQDKQLHL